MCCPDLLFSYGLHAAKAEKSASLFPKKQRGLAGSARDHIQQQLRIAKKQPSWRFQARAKDRPKMEEKRRRQIAGEITHRRRDLADLVRFLDDLARRATPAASRKSKKSLPEDPQPALF